MKHAREKKNQRNFLGTKYPSNNQWDIHSVFAVCWLELDYLVVSQWRLITSCSRNGYEHQAAWVCCWDFRTGGCVTSVDMLLQGGTRQMPSSRTVVTVGVLQAHNRSANSEIKVNEIKNGSDQIINVSQSHNQIWKTCTPDSEESQWKIFALNACISDAQKHFNGKGFI